MKIYCAIAVVLMLVAGEIAGQTVQEIDKEGILTLTSDSGNSTYVVNFWATWCSPCVKEIVHFEELHRSRPDPDLKVILVSLDFPDQLESRVIPFLEQKEITAPVMLMTDLNYNGWIDLVDPAWTGALPATLIFNNRERVFIEKELTMQELLEQVNQILN